MAETRVRIGKQLAKSTNTGSPMVTDTNNEAVWLTPPVGSSKILFYDHDTSTMTWLTIGTNLSIDGSNNLNASAGAGGYSEVQEEGTPLTTRTKINFVGTGITASDNAGQTRTDVTLATFLNTLATQGNVNLDSQVTGTLSISNIDDLVGLSVLGRAANTTGPMAAISAASDFQVLRRSGSSIGFGAIDLSQSNAVTGILDELNGGTGNSSYATGDILYASGTNALNKLPIGTAGHVLRVNPGGTAPVWSSVLDLGFDTKESVRAATTAAITLSNPGTAVFDGVTLTNGQRLLVKNQAAPAENGIYQFNGSGSALTRTVDADSWNELVSAYVWVEEGSTLADTGWLCTVDQGGTLGTTAVTWAQQSGAATITAGAGLTKTGNTLDVGTASTGRIVVNADNIDLASGIVTAQSWGSASSIPVFTTDTYGRVTAVTPTAVSITSTAITDFNEAAQDAVGTILTDSATIDFTYNDATPSITAIVIDDSITFAKMQNIGTGTLIGRSTAATGDPESITVSSGLTLSGGLLTHQDTSTVSNLDTTGAQIIDTLTFDTYGHVTGVTTRNIVLDDINDVVLTSATNGDVLQFNGTNWINTPMSTTVTWAYIEGSTATTIDLDANTGVVKDRNGNNIAFTTPSDLDKMEVYRNGVLQARTGTGTTRDYSVNGGTHEITFVVALASDEIVLIKKFG